ncbi:MAG: tetratricopeptide repeat protein [Chloroflexi bacterium]|nr:tetratricopeptide repeat protein [Chloroflexota bacterium]MCC6894967.1 tetratricopeptide repeat protein [Anaerolineae bacterium]
MRKLDARQVAREKSAFRYSSALERGDFSTVEIILQEAERDTALAQMLAEINMVYESEMIRLSPPTTGLNHSTNHHRKDLLMTTITLPVPQRSVQRWLPFTLAAACLSVLFIGALLMRPNPDGGLLASLQGRASETPTALPTIIPTLTATPFPSVSSAGTALPPTVVPPAGDFTPTPAAAIGVVGQPTSVPPEASPVRNFTFELMKAQDFKTQGQFAEEAKVYESILALEPQYDFVLYRYGLVLLELDRPQDALNAAQQLIAISAGDVRAYILQALANLQLDYPNSALTAAKKGYEINPSDSDLLAVLSQVHLQLGRYDEALRFAEAAIQANSINATAHQAYGWALAALGRRDEAIRSFEQAIAYDGNRFSLYEDLALQYKATNRMDEAIQTLEQFLQRQPDNTAAMIGLCETYGQMGDNPNAERYCEQAVATDPTNAHAYQVLGGVHFRQRNYETAIKDFEQCLTLGSLAVECYYQRGLASFYIGDCDTAWSALTASSAFNPDEAVFEIIKSGLQLITENCPKYKDLVIVLNTPASASVEVAIADAGATFTPTPVPMSGTSDLLATPTPFPMVGAAQQAMEATATPMPIPSVPTGVPVPSEDLVGSSGIACDSQDTVILSPTRKAVVAGKVEVTGIATGEKFGAYRLELIGLATGGNYVELLSSNQPVPSEGTLGELDLGSFPPNNYGLRLVVFDTQNQVLGSCLVNFTLARSADAAEIPANALPAGTASLMPSGFVKVEGAALRDEPSENASVIATLAQNTAVGIYQLSPDGLWLLVVLGDKTQGWVSSSEVLGIEPTNLKPEIMCSGVTGSQPAPLFSRPNLSGNAVAIGSVDPNSNVLVLDMENQSRNSAAWYYIQLLKNPGLVGWVDGNAFSITSYCAQFVPEPATALPTTSNVVPPTVVPPALAVASCTVVNTSDNSVPVYSSPSSSESESLLVNNLAPNTPAQLLFQQTTSDGDNWYLMLAILDGGKPVSGWVDADGVQLVGENCATFR